MTARVAEWHVRTRPLRPKLKLRVDLHGVSVFGPRRERTLIRWEWMEDITAGDGVTVRSANAEVHLPDGAFGLGTDDLAEKLRQARSITRRPDVIESLARQ